MQRPWGGRERGAFKEAQGGHGPGGEWLQRGLEGRLSLRATVRTLAVSEGGRLVGGKDIYDGVPAACRALRLQE